MALIINTYNKKLYRTILELATQILQESSVIFIIVFSGMLFEVWMNIVLPGKGTFDNKILTLILTTSVKISILSTIIYIFLKTGITGIVQGVISHFAEISTDDSHSLSERMFDILILTSSIFALLNIKPILQDTRVGQEFYVTEVFVKYDFIPTLIVLTCIGAVAIVVIVLQRKQRWITRIILILLTVSFVSWYSGLNSFNTRIFETRAAWKAKNYPKTFSKALEALSVSRNTNEKSSSYYWMGVASNRMKKPKDAIYYQNKAIAESPTDGAAYSSLAAAYNATGELDKSYEAAMKCIRYDPSYAWCYLSLSDHYFLQGKYKEGLKYARKAREIDPESPEVRDILKQIESDMKKYNVE